MLRIDASDRRLIRLDKTELQPTDLPSASEIRTLVLTSPDAVVQDVDRALRILLVDIPIRDGEAPRADIICVQPDGTIVLLVLPKEGEGDQQLAEALAVSGQVARWDVDTITKHLTEEQRAQLVQFLSGPVDTLNHRQRIVLISNGSESDLIPAVEWLSAGGVHLSISELRAMKDTVNQDVYLFLGGPGQQPDSVSIVRDNQAGKASAEREEQEQRLVCLTERIAQEERERHLIEQRHRTVSKLAPVGIFHASPQGDYLFCQRPLE